MARICQVGRCSAYTAEEFKESWKTAAGLKAPVSAAMMVHSSADGSGEVGLGGVQQHHQRHACRLFTMSQGWIELAVCFITPLVSQQSRPGFHGNCAVTVSPRQPTTTTTTEVRHTGSTGENEQGSSAQMDQNRLVLPQRAREFLVAPAKIKASKDQRSKRCCCAFFCCCLDFGGES